MPDLSALLAPLKSLKTALAVFLFAAALLFAPFDWLGIKRPAFTTEYESFFVVILFLSAQAEIEGAKMLRLPLWLLRRDLTAPMGGEACKSQGRSSLVLGTRRTIQRRGCPRDDHRHD